MLEFLRRRAREGDRSVPHRFAAVGYPKVGNTWLRLMLGRYVQQLGNMPDLPLFEPSDAPVLSEVIGPQAVGYFTHAPLEWTKQTPVDLTEKNVLQPFRGLKVILLIRHPLDALASFHKQQLYRAPLDPFEGDLASFIRHPVFGLDKIIRFYRIWFERRAEVKNAILWRYEDAIRDPERSLRAVLGFLDLPIDDDRIQDALAFASFDNMKVMELSDSGPTYRSSGFNIFATGDRSNPDAFHVRKGKPGSYRDELSPEDVREFSSIIRERLPDSYGYS